MLMSRAFLMKRIERKKISWTHEKIVHIILNQRWRAVYICCLVLILYSLPIECSLLSTSCRQMATQWDNNEQKWLLQINSYRNRAKTMKTWYNFFSLMWLSSLSVWLSLSLNIIKMHFFIRLQYAYHDACTQRNNCNANPLN